jgi:N-acetylglutamate synthase-like GNAT family acetyltransferase
MNLTLRPATPADIPALTALIAASVRVLQADHCAGREDSLLDPACDAAKIRAFFVHPEWVRKGIGTRVLEACESAALEAGFKKFEMGATLTGVALYKARGYSEVEEIGVPLGNGESLPIVRMEKLYLK